MFYEPYMKISKFKRGDDGHPKVIINSDDRTAEQNEEMTIYRLMLRSVAYARRSMFANPTKKYYQREFYNAINAACVQRRHLVNMGVLI